MSSSWAAGPLHAIRVDWSAVDRNIWQELIARAERPPLEQSWEYGEAASAHFGVEIHRGVVQSDAGSALGFVQMAERRYGRLVSVGQILRGPVWLDAPSEEHETPDAYLEIARSRRMLRREFLFWSPELSDTPAAQRLLRATGKRRMATGYSTSWLDLRKPSASLWLVHIYRPGVQLV